jgi:hypothetical protein
LTFYWKQPELNDLFIMVSKDLPSPSVWNILEQSSNFEAPVGLMNPLLQTEPQFNIYLCPIFMDVVLERNA